MLRPCRRTPHITTTFGPQSQAGVQVLCSRSGKYRGMFNLKVKETAGKRGGGHLVIYIAGKTANAKPGFFCLYNFYCYVLVIGEYGMQIHLWGNAEREQQQYARSQKRSYGRTYAQIKL